MASLPPRLDRARRYLGLLAPVLRSNVGRLDAPWKLTLALTYVCNHRCRHCSIWTRRPKDELSAAEIEALFVANPSIRWLDLTGGEPTARADLPAIIEAAARLPDLLLLHFPTNGSLPDRALEAARIAARGAAKVVLTVSLDGPPAVHDRVRGQDGAWDKAIDCFARLRAEPGVEVVLGMTLTPDNIAHVEQTWLAARTRLGALDRGDFHFNIAQRSTHFYGNENLELPSPEVVLHTLRRFGHAPRSARGLMETSFQALVPRYLDDGRSPVPCQALSASAFVDPWGVVYPCITEDRPVGDLRAEGWSLAELWERTAAAAEDMRAGRCAGCWAPCEAYQSLLGSLPTAAAAAIRGL